jgi:hypothetical protein
MSAEPQAEQSGPTEAGAGLRQPAPWKHSTAPGAEHPVPAWDHLAEDIGGRDEVFDAAPAAVGTAQGERVDLADCGCAMEEGTPQGEPYMLALGMAAEMHEDWHRYTHTPRKQPWCDQIGCGARWAAIVEATHRTWHHRDAENAALREQHGMLEQQRAEAWQQAEALRGQLAEARPVVAAARVIADKYLAEKAKMGWGDEGETNELRALLAALAALDPSGQRGGAGR